MIQDWNIVAEKPAILADVLEVMPALARLRFANPRPSWRKRWAMLRWADVTRRFAPEQALEVLQGDGIPEADEPSVPHLRYAAVHAATLLDLARAEPAESLLHHVSGEEGSADLLHGRLAVQVGRFDDAVAHYERAVALAAAHAHRLSVEVELEARGHLLRLAMARRLPHLALHRRLEQRLVEEDAGVTVGVFRHLMLLDQPDVRDLRLDRTIVGIKSHILRTYAAPHKEREDDIAPVPLHVHGLAKALVHDPMKYVRGISTMASIQWRQGDRQSGYETAAYGEAIARKIWGPKVADVLTEFVEQLLAPLPVEQRGAYSWRMEQRARAANECRRRPGASRPS